MPRLLPFDALEGPPVDPLGGPPARARWTAILAVALAMTATETDWQAAWDGTRSLVPAAGDRTDWDAAALTAAPDLADPTGLTDGIDDPASAGTARLQTGDVVLDLLWEAPLTLAEVRLETYTDLLGTGFRLGIAADSTTQGGPDCVNARITQERETTAVQWCSRSDQHEPVDMAAFLGKEGDDDWAPEQLYVTETANLDPPDRREATQVDYYGFGLNTGDPDATGLWPRNLWTGADFHQQCDDPDLRIRIDDLHLTDRYADPAEHTRPLDFLYDSSPAFPAEDRLLSPACVLIFEEISTDSLNAEPFQTDSAVPLAGWTQFNAATRDPRQMRTAFVADVRSCDTEPRFCTSDSRLGPNTLNLGAASEWMPELLELPGWQQR
jgi:hypothetical protein